MSASEFASLEWVGDDVSRVPVFYDRNNRLVSPFHDFVALLAADKDNISPSSQATRSAVNAAAYALLGWLRLLEERRMPWTAGSEQLLRIHRDSAYKAVLNSTRSKKSERAAKRTVNVRLQWIYDFYLWAQNDENLCSKVIGPGCVIESALTVGRIGRLAFAKSHKLSFDAMFPVCFRGVSGSAGGVQYFASAEDKRAMLVCLSSGKDPFVVERNSIIVEMADRVGWRVGTLTYLSIGDFDEARLVDADDAGVSVIPAAQKFGYGFAFSVPHSLFARVRRFIKQRSVWLDQHGFSEKSAHGRLFVSSRRGAPLGDKTITQLICAAFRSIGIPANIGAGPHSYRRKFSVDSTSDDLRMRKAEGFSTSLEDVLHANALRMGHKNIHSQGPYQRAVRHGLHSSEPYQLKERVRDLEAELSERESRISQLERQLQEASVGHQKKRKRARKL